MVERERKRDHSQDLADIPAQSEQVDLYSQAHQAYPFLVEKIGLGPSIDQLRALGVITTPFEPTPAIFPTPRGVRLETGEDGWPIFPPVTQETQGQTIQAFSQEAVQPAPKKIEGPYADILEGRKVWEIGESTELRKRLFAWAHVHEIHGGMRLIKDVIGILRHLPDGHGKIRIEKYTDKLESEEKKSGHPESSSYGMGKIAGEPATVFGQHIENFFGTAGIVTGKKIAYAANLARRTNSMLVAYYESGGARMQDAVLGLVKTMAEAPHAIHKFKKERRKPYVAVLGPNVWGGILAGPIPQADITATVGGEAGFAGRGPVDAYQKRKMTEGAQSAEAHVFHRNIMIKLSNEAHLQEFLEGVARHGANREKITEAQAKNLPPLSEKPYIWYPAKKGFYTLYDIRDYPDEFVEAGLPYEFGTYPAQDNYHNFILLSRDARRPDTQYLATQAFDDVVPLSNSMGLKHPAIAFYLGKIGPQTVLIAGYQPSYHIMYKDNNTGENIIGKTPASPGCADYRMLKRVLRYGERMEYPLIKLVGLLGTKPTEEEEISGIWNEIGDCIDLVNHYDGITMGYITDVLGSGGGMALMPWGDYAAMFEDAQGYVAEPRSAVPILYPRQQITPEMIARYANQSRPTAKDMEEFKLIHNIIYLPVEGPYVNPLGMVQAFRDDVAVNLARLNKKPKWRKERDRDRRLSQLGISPVRLAA